MNKEKLSELKENKEILYIYRIPCSLSDYQYVIIGNVKTHLDKYDCYYSTEDWFSLMKSGSLLPYVCATIGRQGKIKEEVNIYDRPNLLTLRKYILTEELPNWRVYQELQWADQVLVEFRVNRPDVFKNIKLTKKVVKNEIAQFLHNIEPMYHSAIANNSK